MHNKKDIVTALKSYINIMRKCTRDYKLKTWEEINIIILIIIDSNDYIK